MPLTVDDAWSLIDDTSRRLKSCQLLSVREQRKISHALGVLKAPPPGIGPPNQLRSPSMQKRQKFYGFLLMVLHSCGPYGVLVAAITLTQTTVSGMTNNHRNALCEKLEPTQGSIMTHQGYALPGYCLGCRRTIELTSVDNPRDHGFRRFGLDWHYCGCCAVEDASLTGTGLVEAMMQHRYVSAQIFCV